MIFLWIFPSNLHILQQVEVHPWSAACLGPYAFSAASDTSWMSCSASLRGMRCLKSSTYCRPSLAMVQWYGMVWPSLAQPGPMDGVIFKTGYKQWPNGNQWEPMATCAPASFTAIRVNKCVILCHSFVWFRPVSRTEPIKKYLLNLVGHHTPTLDDASASSSTGARLAVRVDPPGCGSRLGTTCGAQWLEDMDIGDLWERVTWPVTSGDLWWPWASQYLRIFLQISNMFIYVLVWSLSHLFDSETGH
jgi:hypothetical protein